MNIQREILFRGFHPCEDGDTTIYVEGEAVKGRRIEGSLLIYPDGDCFICCDDADPCILNKDDVLPSTVCQYTGLLDKNGRKIFEGDMLYCIDRIVCVRWNAPNGTWDCDFIRYTGELCSNGIVPVEWKYRAEVIGTIWD